MLVTKVRPRNESKESIRINILGKFDAEDLLFYFHKLGIKVELEEAKKLVEK